MASFTTFALRCLGTTDHARAGPHSTNTVLVEIAPCRYVTNQKGGCCNLQLPNRHSSLPLPRDLLLACFLVGSRDELVQLTRLAAQFQASLAQSIPHFFGTCIDACQCVCALPTPLLQSTNSLQPVFAASRVFREHELLEWLTLQRTDGWPEPAACSRRTLNSGLQVARRRRARRSTPRSTNVYTGIFSSAKDSFNFFSQSGISVNDDVRAAFVQDLPWLRTLCSRCCVVFLKQGRRRPVSARGWGRLAAQDLPWLPIIPILCSGIRLWPQSRPRHGLPGIVAPVHARSFRLPGWCGVLAIAVDVRSCLRCLGRRGLGAIALDGGHGRRGMRAFVFGWVRLHGWNDWRRNILEQHMKAEEQRWHAGTQQLALACL